MGGTWRTVMLGLAAAGMALAWLANELWQRPDSSSVTIGVAGAGVLALWGVFARLVRHFRDLERLAADITAPRHRGEVPAEWEAHGDELGRLAGALAELSRRDRRGGGSEGARLGAVADALEEPVLVLSDLGRIMLINPAAARLLGPGAAVGTSAHAVLDRAELTHAIERARGAGQPVAARLRGVDGAELPAHVVDFGFQSGVALIFPFAPPAHPALAADPAEADAVPPGVDADAPLATLPMVALWVALAGDRVISVGTVRLSGARVFRTVSLDVPVNPGEPVPATALSGQGITADEMAGARPFAAAWPTIAEALHHAVVVAVDAHAALAALHAEEERAGLPAADMPPALDLRRLATALDPASAGEDLPTLAARFGVEPHPGAPHALLTADLAAALIRRLDERGVATLGEAAGLASGTAPALPPG